MHMHEMQGVILRAIMPYLRSMYCATFFVQSCAALCGCLLKLCGCLVHQDHVGECSIHRGVTRTVEWFVFACRVLLYLLATFCWSRVGCNIHWGCMEMVLHHFLLEPC